MASNQSVKSQNDQKTQDGRTNPENRNIPKNQENTTTLHTWFGDFDLVLLENGFTITSFQTCPKDVDILCERFISYSSSGFYGKKRFDVDLREIAKKSGFVSDDIEYVSVLRDVCLQSAKYKISQSLTNDKKIIQAIEALDDVNEAINLLSERLVEWYGVYAPDIDVSGEDCPRSVLEALDSYLSKKPSHPPLEIFSPDFSGNAPDNSSGNHSLSIQKINRFSEIKSPASPLFPEEAVLIRLFAADILTLYERRSDLESYISSKMQSTAPTLSSVAGESLGARLISMSGGLQQLSSLPSGTVQVMGAEKSLFKHLRARAPSPKHGVIFNHNLINTSPFPIRGKLARTLAFHISLAARVDFYSGVYKPEIAESLEQKVIRIRKSHIKKATNKSGKKDSDNTKEEV